MSLALALLFFAATTTLYVYVVVKVIREALRNMKK
jgi:hypothetical protein